MSRIVGRDCDCEDFPCCGHGITEADLQYEREYDDGPFFGEEEEPLEYVSCQDCGDDVREDHIHVGAADDVVCHMCCGCGGSKTRCGRAD